MPVVQAYIPSPPSSAVHLGPVPIRAYALFIIAGIVVAVLVCDRRLQARAGTRPGVTADIATIGVPFGLVGARLYHLATNPELYWGKNGQGTVAALEIWHGGLGIWGGVLFGALGAYIGARRYGVNYAVLADSLAPGLPLAQAIGRFGNYFNQELYGRPTHLPWALHITHSGEGGAPGYYQPTFLYEAIWDVGVAVLVILLDRRLHFARGRAFALYVATYTIGRGWIEALRIDEAHRFLGLRLNDWTSIVVFVAAVTYFVVQGRKPPPDRDSDPETEPAPQSLTT